MLQPEYLQQNPLGTIPLLVDGETRMTESSAIPQYLATRYGPSDLAVGPSEPDYGLWLDWLHRSEATLTFPQTIVLRYTRFEPDERKLKQAADDYTQWFFSRLKHLTRALEDGRKWLCAGRFTMADVCTVYALLLAKDLGLDYKFTPEIAAYWERAASRPGFLAAQAAQTGD
jgi:glutathione S-transferase